MSSSMNSETFQTIELGNQEKLNNVTVETLAKDDLLIERWYHVDTAMLPAKLAYLFDGGKRLGTVPFMVAFFISLGLKKSEAGFIVGFRVLGSIVGGPVWSVLADKKQAHRILFLILIVCSCVVLCSQTPISLAFTSEEFNRCPSLNSGDIQNQTLVNATKESINGDIATRDRRKLFFILLAVNIVGSFFEGSISPFIDFVVLRKMQLNQNKNIQYGKQRITGPIGAGLGILFSNLLVAHFPAANFTCFSAIYFLYVMWSLLTAVCTFHLFRGVKHSKAKQLAENNARPVRKLSMQHTFRNTCLKFDVILLLMTTFFIGSFYAVYRAYTFVFLRQLQANSLMLTLAMTIPYVGSIPVLYFEEHVTRILGGPWKTITFTFLIFSVRFLSMSFIQNPWYALLIEALHPLTAPLFLVAGMRKIKEISPPKILTIMVTIYNIVWYSFGNIAGSSIGGVIYEEIGGRSLYKASAGVAGIWGLVLIVYIIWSKIRSNTKQLSQ